MAAIPQFQNTTQHLIDCKDITNESPRPYLGMSSIGDECERKLWYGFHWAVKKVHSAKTERIFRDGHNAEANMIADLKALGYECFYRFDGEAQEMTGEVGEKQEGFVDCFGHFKGHCDGRVMGVIEAPKTEHLLEMKTSNDKNFKELQKKGVKEAKPIHYAQMQIYMRKGKLTRALYMAYNKNTSEYYFERVNVDKGFADDLIRKAEGIITATEPPACKFPKTWFSCKWCDYKEICHEDAKPEINCRTCEHSDIEDGGVWSCSKKDEVLPYEAQLKACRKYKRGWGF